MRGASRERESYWRGIVARQAESGLNAAQFCRRRKLSATRFYLWKRRLRDRDAVGDGCEVDRGVGPALARFVPVRIEPRPEDSAPSAMRVHWRAGIQVEIPLSADPAAVEHMLRALARVAPLAGGQDA